MNNLVIIQYLWKCNTTTYLPGDNFCLNDLLFVYFPVACVLLFASGLYGSDRHLQTVVHCMQRVKGIYQYKDEWILNKPVCAWRHIKHLFVTFRYDTCLHYMFMWHFVNKVVPFLCIFMRPSCSNTLNVLPCLATHRQPLIKI